MEALLYDLRHALRSLGKRPLLAAVAVLSIAIGIGANTAILSVADALLFRALPGLEDSRRTGELAAGLPISHLGSQLPGSNALR